VLIEVASAVVEVEHRARLVVGELLEEYGRLIIFVQDAAVEVSGKPRIEPSEGIGDSLANSRCTLGVGFSESFKSFAEPRCIFMSDREDADAALRAAGLAGKMLATATYRVSERSINNLY
jgi:hypothetical protein